MEPLDPVALLNDAIAGRNWPLLAVVVAVIVVPIVLAALGKNVPIVKTILDAVLSAAVKLFPKKAAPAVAPSDEVTPKVPEGVGSVVKIEEENNK